jgi:transposase
MSDTYLTVPKLAAEIGTSAVTVSGYIRRGQVEPDARVGRRALFKPERVQEIAQTIQEHRMRALVRATYLQSQPNV